MIAMKLRQRIEQLEARHASIRQTVKRMLPGWLIEEFVQQGARLDVSGNLDLSSLSQMGTKLERV
jgi:DNA recombination-dependent growth factor C